MRWEQAEIGNHGTTKAREVSDFIAETRKSGDAESIQFNSVLPPFRASAIKDWDLTAYLRGSKPQSIV